MNTPSPEDRYHALHSDFSVAQKDTFTDNLYYGAANSACVVQTLDLFASTIKKKTVLVLDNATIHTAKLVKEKIGQWRQKGLYFQFTLAYCTELNRLDLILQI